MSTKKILIGLMAGITTGTICGVWLTSKKGIDARKKIFFKGNKYAEALKEKFNQSLGGLLGSSDMFLIKEKEVAKEGSTTEEIKT